MVTIQVVTSYGYYPSGYILWLHPSGYILWLLSKWLHPMVTIQVVTSYGYYPSGYILWLLSKWLHPMVTIQVVTAWRRDDAHRKGGDDEADSRGLGARGADGVAEAQVGGEAAEGV